MPTKGDTKLWANSQTAATRPATLAGAEPGSDAVPIHRPAIDDAEAARRARLVHRATTAFHHPSLVAQTAADDLEPELRALSALLLGGLRASPRGCPPSPDGWVNEIFNHAKGMETS